MEKMITIQVPESQMDVIIQMLESFKQAAVAAKGANADQGGMPQSKEPAGLEGLTDELIASGGR